MSELQHISYILNKYNLSDGMKLSEISRMLRKEEVNSTLKR